MEFTETDFKTHTLEDRKVLGENIRYYRKANLGISQQELADRANIYFSIVGKVERAQIETSFFTICSIANVLGVSVKELLTPRVVKGCVDGKCRI